MFKIDGISPSIDMSDAPLPKWREFAITALFAIVVCAYVIPYFIKRRIMQNPLMLRKNHDEILANEKRRRQEAICDLVRVHENEERELKKDLHEVVKKLSSLAVVSDPHDPRRWRLVVDLDGEMIQALERGNDEGMIENIAESMKYDIIQRLKYCNFQRPGDVGLGRNPKVGDAVK